MANNQTPGQKNLLHSFQNDSSNHQPTNIFTPDKLGKIHKSSHKKVTRPKRHQTSIRVDSDISSMLMSMKNVLRYRNVNEVIRHLVDNQFSSFNHEQKIEYNAFKRVYTSQKK